MFQYGERNTATPCSILAWRIPRTEEPGGLQSEGVAKSRTQLPTLIEAYTSIIEAYTSIIFLKSIPLKLFLKKINKQIK